MHEMRAVGDHLDPLQDEAVDRPVHLALVAGNGARGKDDAIARGETDDGMLAIGDAAHCCARFALAPGRKHDDAIAREHRIALKGEEIREPVEITILARDVDRACHRAAGDDDFAARRHCGQCHRANARDIRGEGGDHHARRRLCDQLAQRLRHLAFRRALAFANDVGRVADEGEDALLTELAETRFIGRQTDSGRIVVLPIAAMDGEACRRADRQRAAFRDRMRDRDEFDAKRSELNTAALPNDVDLHLRRVGLGEAPRLQQARRERRRIKRAAQSRPQSRDRADVVLMRMRDDERDEIALDLVDEGDIGIDEFDPRQIGPGKGQTAIDHDPFAPAR